jgi:arylsulfatase A-like enzyme
MSKRPNILFFFADDMRYDTISALGNDEIITPNLDKLVACGTSFTQMHIPSGTSGAVCMPSRSMLHTGRTLFHIKNEGQTISPDHELLGETLQRAGYKTFGTGKWHNGTESFARSFKDGGDILFGGMEDHWMVPVHSFDPTGKYESRANKISNAFYDNKETVHICDHVAAGKHSSELFCDAAVDFINKQDGENPFFAYVSFMAPHDPRTMPKKFSDMYDENEITLPPNFMAMHPIEYNNTKCRDEVLAPYPRTPEDTKRQMMEYYAMITHLDYELGKVIKTLEDKGLRDDTIIIFAADNGLSVGQHGLFGKQNHFEHSIRVPFVIAGPDIPENKKTDSYAYLLDIYPTICDLLGIEKPDTVEGESFADVIIGKKERSRNTLYFAYIDKIRSVKDDRYKLIRFTHEGKTTSLLYDIVNDPYELANLYEIKEYKDVVARLEKLMLQYKDEWDDEKHPLGKRYWDEVAF